MDNQNNQNQISMAELFQDYAIRKEKGHITWTRSPNGVAIATIKRFDLSQEEILPPIQIEVSTIQIGKLKNEIKRKITILDDQILDLQGQKQKLQAEVRTGWVSAIENDVEETEKDDEPNDSSKQIN